MIKPSLIFSIRVLGLILPTALLGVGCAGVPKNRGSNEASAQMACTSPTDPQCIGQGSALVSIPLSKGTLKSLQGKCELFIENQSDPQPCEGVSLVFRSSRENLERAAVVKGFDFHVDDLSADTYKVQAKSPIYDLETESKDLIKNPDGQNVKIRVRARPRP